MSARDFLKALNFVAVGVVVALAVCLPQRASATHDPVISYVQRGVIGSVTCSPFKNDPTFGHLWIPNSHACWHNDEPEMTFSAIDYPKPAGTSVHFYYRGDFQHFQLFLAPPTSGCTGVEARLYKDFVGNESFRRGSVHYLHVDPAAGVVGKVADTYEWLGAVIYPDNCTTTGPHLHQSAETPGPEPDDDPGEAPGNTMYYNRWDNPDREKYHPHTIYWDPNAADYNDDDDGNYSDILEIRMGTDPLDACADTTTPDDEEGFDYGEPISPWGPDFNDDRVVNILDYVRLGPPVFNSSSGNPNYRARLDLDGNGTINVLDITKMPPLNTSCTP